MTDPRNISTRVIVRECPRDRAFMVHDYDTMRLLRVSHEEAPKKRGATPKDQAACKAKLARLPWLDDGYAEPVEMATGAAFLVGMLIGGFVTAGIVGGMLLIGGAL